MKPLIKLTKHFLKNPYKETYLRELAKHLKLSPFATKKYADLLIKENIITEERKANLRYFKANTKSLFYKHLKISFNLRSIEKSGLITHIKDNIPNLSSITLFGSVAKGEDDQNSDIDLLIIGKKKYLDLSKFQERQITTHFFSWSEWNKQAKDNQAFYYEVTTYGIPLYGELPIIKWK